MPRRSTRVLVTCTTLPSKHNVKGGRTKAPKARAERRAPLFLRARVPDLTPPASPHSMKLNV
eukprot:2326914-Prymnesium_polylepis.1